MTYPGGKGGAGVYQAIINQLPPHAVYIEPFAGGASVLRFKRPAPASIVIDIDGDVAGALAAASPPMAVLEIIHGCGIQFLELHKFTGAELVYCDPPYLISSRRSQRPIYRHELGDMDHAWLLRVLKRLPCFVAISGYTSPLYERELADWRRVTFKAVTRGGTVADERLWMNYPTPAALHDYRYLGSDFRERERIKRKAGRWRRNLEALPELERQAILSAVLELASSDVTIGPGIPSPDPAMPDPESLIVGNGDDRSTSTIVGNADAAAPAASPDLARAAE